MKGIKLCNWLCSSSHFSASVIWNIGEFGAKNYYTDHWTANIIHGFRDSVPVLKIHAYYYDMLEFEQLSIPTQVLQGKDSVLM